MNSALPEEQSWERRRVLPWIATIFRSCGFEDSLNPAADALLELRWVKKLEHLSERIVGRDTTRQHQKGLEPFLLGSSVSGDLHRIIGATDVAHMG
jgi:hypothetical protein